MRGTFAIATAAIVAALLVPSSALAGQDQLKGGTVSLQLQSSKALRLKPSALTLPITSGAVDPTDGSGQAFVTGGVKAKRGKSKTKVKFTSFSFGSNGGPGFISARVGKNSISNFGSLSGGSVVRDGWGARISGVSATLSAGGARALNRAFSGKGKKGAKSAESRGIKSGLSLGTLTAVTVPLQVEVVPGSGNMTLTVSITNPFVTQKLPAHCVDPLSGGVSAIAPASSNLLGTVTTFPVAGGTAAPDFSDGELLTAGGQKITKNNGGLIPIQHPNCTSSPPPAGTSVLSTDLGIAFAPNLLKSLPTLPGGPLPRAPLGNIDFSTGTRSIDPNTKMLTITGATVKIADLAATTLNQALPTASGNPADDFSSSDVLGTIDVTAKLR